MDDKILTQDDLRVVKVGPDSLTNARALHRSFQANNGKEIFS